MLDDRNLFAESRDRLSDLFLKDAFYYYSFDVNLGIIDYDIIDKTGHNYTRAAGLCSPCLFNDLIERSFDENFMDVSYSEKNGAFEISTESLIKAFKEGRRKVEIEIHVPARHLYNRITYYLEMDEETSHVMAYVVCQDITDLQEADIKQLSMAKQELTEIDKTISSAEIGIWKIELFDGERPKMYGTDKMFELLGVEDKDIPPEALYIAWHSRIRKSSLPIVEAVIEDMIMLGKAESTYKWVHPSKEDSYVRFGGTSYRIENKGVVLRGYHYDVTDIMNAEARQKELLAEALEEAKNQKLLLQQALDNYKQADYDRRTDFLTGLRNRQDMFEMLHDSLSNKREQISTMYMMDIDNFKMLNDTYGHSYGDECLKKIGEALIEYGRNNNLYFYRYGGEEILGIGFSNPKTDREIAAELVKLIYDLQIKRDDVEAGAVTVSLGFTSNNKRYEKMIDKADTAMYKAKSTGKNRAVCFEDL